MRDKELEKFLETFEVPGFSEAAKRKCIDNMKNAAKPTAKEQRFFLFDLMKIQFTYLWKERILYLFAVSLFAAVLLIFLLLTGSEAEMRMTGFVVNVGMAPLFIIPMLISLYRSKKARMGEFEAACKYDLRKMVVSRLLVNGVVAFAVMILLWVAVGIRTYDFAMSRLFLSLIVYNVTLICSLWFGRKSMTRGILGSAVWLTAAGVLMGSDTRISIIYEADSFVSFAGLAVSCAALACVIYKYAKNTSFEGEDARWNLLLTD